MNRWNIPAWLEDEVRARDRACIYCGVPFDEPARPHRDRASWEHIINDATIITRENIALCCVGCNASKGVRSLSAWLGSARCRTRGITAVTIAAVARAALEADAARTRPAADPQGEER